MCELPVIDLALFKKLEEDVAKFEGKTLGLSNFLNTLPHPQLQMST